MTTVCIEYVIPQEDEDLSLEEAIVEHLGDDDELDNAVLQDVARHDARASYVEESFHIANVEVLDQERVSIECQYDWEAFYGCRDLCKYETESRVLVGELSGCRLAVKIVLPDPRTTLDEL